MTDANGDIPDIKDLTVLAVDPLGDYQCFLCTQTEVFFELAQAQFGNYHTGYCCQTHCSYSVHTLALLVDAREV